MLFDYHLFLSLRYIFHSKVIFIFCLAAVSEIGGDFMDCYCHCQSWISSILWAKEKTKKEKTKNEKWVLKYRTVQQWIISGVNATNYIQTPKINDTTSTRFLSSPKITSDWIKFVCPSCRTNFPNGYTSNISVGRSTNLQCVMTFCLIRPFCSLISSSQILISKFHLSIFENKVSKTDK